MKKIIFLVIAILLFGFGNSNASSTTIYWDAPTTFVDGSALPPTEISWYRVYWKVSSATTYDNYIDVGNVLTATIDGLNTGTYNFVVTVFSIYAEESAYSNVVTRVIEYVALTPSPPKNLRGEPTMAIPVTDDFNRASLGANWTSSAAFNYGMQIVSNKAGTGSGGDTGAAYWNADTPSNDQGAEVNAWIAGGPIVRNNGQDCYYVLYTAANTLKVYKRIAKVSTQLGADISTTFAAGDLLGLEVVGTTLTIYVNGVSVGTRDGTGGPASGSFGMVSDSYSPSGLDNFRGWNVGGGAAISVTPFGTLAFMEKIK